MADDRKVLDKFWITFGKLILVNVCTVLWFIFILIKKPQSYIIVGISVLVYLLYEVISIAIMVSWDMEELERY